MDGQITIRYLQHYLRQKDHPAGKEKEAFLKLAEEVGEVARAMHKGLLPKDANDVIGTLSEELWDVLYYALMLANLYGIDLEEVIPRKEAYNAQRHPGNIPFELGR